MAVVYEVVVTCEPAVADRLAEYMTERHLPQILATGCFSSIAFEQSTLHSYRTRYLADSQLDLDRYFAEHTAALRDDFAKHFPSGITSVERVNWNVLRTYRRETESAK
ncbi:hypothetical protein SDRG_16526 [Saprolegnia diclina VS20]|uniref:DUF4286 domain-containing protein n=1 Tax=Saprolegnia diclina (strain VS20) TaxID=1156394 RepID=T0PJN6_SAPDV|nr:hypothetical protein SDRG_16526 [Saprolegnia diclina VS20]EQC25594.1 hypothetical protein SDRG_16526 [Saprolegnia diclina VS20]|eukprot:XP_008620962.1 hypothetical protein SDRG_16526 [Saprolegnia diclina VS20]